MTSRLEKENIPSLLFKLSLPAVLGMLVSAAYNVADRIFISQLSQDALTGVGITMPIQVLQMAFVLLIGIGASTLVSISLGKKDRQEAEKLLANSLSLLCLALLVFALIVLCFTDPILRALQVSEKVFPYARTYIRVLIGGSVISIPGFCLNNSLRAIGEARRSMIIVVISALLNIALDPLLIFTFGWGIAGAAVATVFSQLVLTVYVTYYFIHRCPVIRLRARYLKPTWAISQMIFANGMPTFVLQIMATVVGVLMNIFLKRYGGDDYIAAMTIISSVFSIFHMVVVGISQGNQPIVGYNVGAGRTERVYQSLQLAIGASVVFSLGLFLVTVLFPDPLLSLFIKDDPNFLALVRTAMRIDFAMIVLVGPQTILSQYFQAVKKPKMATFLSTLRYATVLVPLLLLLSPLYGIYGVLAAQPAADFLSFGIIAWAAVREIRLLKSTPPPSVAP